MRSDRLLLDSNVVWRWMTAPQDLRPEAREAIGDQGRPLAVSVVTFWELEIKQASRKLDLTLEFWPTLQAMVDSVLSVDQFDAVAAARLTPHHRDPFDRMIIAQSMNRGMTVVTSDREFEMYDVTVIRG